MSLATLGVFIIGATGYSVVTEGKRALNASKLGSSVAGVRECLAVLKGIFNGSFLWEAHVSGFCGGRTCIGTASVLLVF